LSTHFHSEDIVEYGLQDDCDRCSEHAAHPLESLDNSVLLDLAERVRHNVRSRSENEAVALKNMAQAITNAKKLIALRIIGYNEVLAVNLEARGR
jgi:hypothetical protein